MKWHPSLSKRLVKKLAFPLYHDGAGYTYNMWTKLVSYMANLKPGDKIYNYYTNQEDIVKFVKFDWSYLFGTKLNSNLKRRKIGKGKYIHSVIVVTVSNYYLYDETCLGKEKFKEIRNIDWE